MIEREKPLWIGLDPITSQAFEQSRPETNWDAIDHTTRFEYVKSFQANQFPADGWVKVTVLLAQC